MNALEKIAEKDKEGRELTKIEVAIYWVWNDTHTNMGIAYEAAEENAAMQARIEKATALIEKWRGEADPDGEVDQYDEEIRATYGTLLYCSNELQNALKGEK